jgi:hypothetical protein
MRLMILLGLALCAGAVAPAAAQTPTAIKVPDNAAWKHAGSGVILRSKIAGYPRGTIADSSSSELDVMVQYAEGGPTSITLYLFHPAMMNVPVWFDRSETQILLRRDAYGKVTPAAPARAFAAPHAGTLSAMQRVYVPGSGAYKSTGLVMIPLGEWLVAVRVSSTELDAAALEGKLGEIVNGIAWPDKIAESPAAAPVAPCAGTLAYAKKAKPKKMDMAQSLMGAIIFGAAADAAKEEKKTPEPDVPLCREGDANAQYGVYRRPDSTNSYVIAMGDAGRTVDVGPSFALEEKDAGYSLSFGELDRRLIYPSFDKFPSPAVAVDAVMKLQPVSSVSRNGKDVTIGM